MAHSAQRKRRRGMKRGNTNSVDIFVSFLSLMAPDTVVSLTFDLLAFYLYTVLTRFEKKSSSSQQCTCVCVCVFAMYGAHVFVRIGTNGQSKWSILYTYIQYSRQTTHICEYRWATMTKRWTKRVCGVEIGEYTRVYAPVRMAWIKQSQTYSIYEMYKFSILLHIYVLCIMYDIFIY